MARPSIKRSSSGLTIPPLAFQIQPDQATRPIPHLVNAKGIETGLTPEQMDTDQASLLENFWRNENGKIQIRQGTSTLGTAASTTCIHVESYSRGDGKKFLIRWLSTPKIQYYNNGTWTDITGVFPTLAAGTFVSTAAWGPNQLIYCCNQSAPHALDMSTFASAILTGTPPNADSVAVFGNRVIALVVGTNTTRMQWSVKNNSNDWTGTGSGFEDVIPGPAGGGKLAGLFPVSDTEAILLRASEAWMVSLTGQVDAPFGFNFMFPIPVKEFRAGAVGIGGVYITTPNDVYFVSREGPRSIGAPIINKYLKNLSGTYAQTGLQGRYDVFRQLYYVMIPQATPTSTEILIYHDKWQCWTSFNYPVVASAFAVHNAPVDPNFSTTVPIRGPVLITNEATARVIYESAATTTDVKTSGTQTLTATAILAAQRPVDFKRRVKIEEITIDTDGGESNSFVMAATLYVPSTYGGTAVETITYGGSVAITSNKLRARSQIRGTYEREGFVPQVVVTGAPSLIINEIDTLIQDGSPIIGNSGDRARITVDGSYRAITDVSGSIRVIA